MKREQDLEFQSKNSFYENARRERDHEEQKFRSSQVPLLNSREIPLSQSRNSQDFTRTQQLETSTFEQRQTLPKAKIYLPAETMRPV